MLRWIHGKQQQQPIIFRPVPVRGDRDPDLLCHGWDRQHDGYRWVFVNAFVNSISEPFEKELLEYVCFPNFLFLFYNLFALFFSVDNIIINRKLISLLLILIFDMSFRIYVYTLYNWKCIERKKRYSCLILLCKYRRENCYHKHSIFHLQTCHNSIVVKKLLF